MGRANRGFQPSVVKELLEIPDEAFRYWRKNLDIQPTRKYFDRDAIFAYKVIASFVRDKHVPVRVLKKCDLGPIFSWREHAAIGELAEYWVLLNENSGCLEFTDAHHAMTALLNSPNCQALALRPLVKSHLYSLFAR